MAFTPLSKERHAGMHVKPLQSYDFVADTAVLPLYLAEMPHAARAYALAFIKQDNGFMPVSVMSTEPGKNMFVAPNGRWVGSYVPAVVRRDPFALIRVKDSDQFAICVNDERDRLSPNEGQPLFDAEGAPSSFLDNLRQFLEQLESNRVLTERVCAAIAEKDLFSAWDLQVRKGEEVKTITGLYRIDETKMNQVADSDFLDLRHAGALGMAYMHFMSTVNINALGQLAAAHDEVQKKAAQQAQPQPQNLDLDKAFGISSDDDQFNF